MIPLHCRSSADAAMVRALLTSQGYTAEGICERLGLSVIYDLTFEQQTREGKVPDDGLDLLLQLFIYLAELPRQTVTEFLGVPGVAALEALGLLEGEELVAATVLLYPVLGLWLASDLPPAQGGTADAPDDVVYPAITSSVRTFLSTFPEVAGKRVLELCSGTGVAALAAAQGGAAAAVAVDITARSTAFAHFNAFLNDVPLTALQGDLYAPVAGEQFDIILAHPPYVPSLKTRAIFRDGGEDGEQISRAILERAADFLAPGGMMQCTCMLSDRVGASALERVCALLGDAADAFDVLVLQKAELDQHGPFVQQILRATAEELPEVVDSWRHYRSLGVQRLMLSTVVLYRHGEARPGIAAVARRDVRIGWPEVQWLLRVYQLTHPAVVDLAAWLASRPRMSRYAHFQQQYRFRGEPEQPWEPTEGEVQIVYPAFHSMAVEPDEAALLTEFDGSRSFEALWQHHVSEGAIPATQSAEAFMQSMLPLVVAGVLETDRLPFPLSRLESSKRRS